MSDPKHARLMLTLAGKDVKALQGMESSETFANEVFGFHVQQAVEKTLKAWLSLEGVPYPRIHDLEQLVSLLEQRGQVVTEEIRALCDFTDFAVQFRYEGFEMSEGDLDRPSVIRGVHSLLEHVEQRLRNRANEPR